MEPLAIVSLISAIVQFIDFGDKIVGRLNDFRHSLNEVPKVFRKIHDQLPLFMDTLRRTQNRANAGHLGEETAKALKPVVERCLALVKQLEGILVKALPLEKDSTWSRCIKAITSLARDKTVQQITLELESYVRVLTYHEAATSSDIGGQLVSRGVLQPPAPLQKPLQVALLPSENITLVDAIGRSRVLPYEFFKSFKIFKAFLEDAFEQAPGTQWVKNGRYQLFRFESNKGSLLTPGTWSRSISLGVKIYMSMVVDHGHHLHFDLECPGKGCEGRLLSRSTLSQGWAECTLCKKEVLLLPPQAPKDLKSKSIKRPLEIGNPMSSLYVRPTLDNEPADKEGSDTRSHDILFDYKEISHFKRVTKRLHNTATSNPALLSHFSTESIQVDDSCTKWAECFLENKALFGFMRIIRYEIQNMEDLKEALEDIFTQHNDMEIVKLLLPEGFELLDHKLSNLKIFSHTINHDAESENPGKLILAACFAILDYGRQNKIPLEDILELMAELNHSFAICQNSSTEIASLLSGSLMRLYNSYIDYCIIVVDCFRSISRNEPPDSCWKTSPRLARGKAALQAHAQNIVYEGLLKEERSTVIKRLKQGHERVQRRMRGL